jgi:hypothetical protein
MGLRRLTSDSAMDQDFLRYLVIFAASTPRPTNHSH